MKNKRKSQHVSYSIKMPEQRLQAIYTVAFIHYPIKSLGLNLFYETTGFWAILP